MILFGATPARAKALTNAHASSLSPRSTRFASKSGTSRYSDISFAEAESICKRGKISVSTIRARDEHPRGAVTSDASNELFEGEYWVRAEAPELSKWQSTSCMIGLYRRELSGIELGADEEAQATAP
jgi:hypothetical protein